MKALVREMERVEEGEFTQLEEISCVAKAWQHTKTVTSVPTLCGMSGQGEENCRVLRLCPEPTVSILVTPEPGTLASSQGME